jgi:CRP/FNR family transcriptional regulator
MNGEDVGRWIAASPRRILEHLGPRLYFVEAEHYRTMFQDVESRLAALLLELAGEGSDVEGFAHEDLGAQLGTYRETVTNALRSLKDGKIIEIGRLKITLLNKRALKELSEL